MNPDRVATDEQLAAWVPNGFIPENPADQASRAAGISARVLAVIRVIRAQYETPVSEPADIAEAAD